MSEAPPAPDEKDAAREVAERARKLLDGVRRAIRRACPRDLAGLSEDLVQAAVLRVLEREHVDGQRKAISYAWHAAFSVTIDELRKLRRRRTLTLERGD